MVCFKFKKILFPLLGTGTMGTYPWLKLTVNLSVLDLQSPYHLDIEILIENSMGKII